MVSNSYNRWLVAGATFGLWALVAASAVYWGFKLTARSDGIAAAPPTPRPILSADPAAVARLLGASPVAAVAPPMPSLASRFALVGVAADSSRHGAALISVDGKPARPFRVGALVDEGLVLQSVESRRAVLAARADGPAALMLELPPARK